ncbi:hypothetical protein GQ44DRAFT_727616 [Phaeosphaeriaceae sp. PMI808]|nr:hypothetical protein GQ44DRAFT_727616 [Phaeosphaeriaceae sp. PMI808]
MYCVVLSRIVADRSAFFLDTPSSLENKLLAFTISSIHTKIQEAIYQNAILLKGLHETASAASQLHQQITYIQDLDAQIALATKQVADLKRKTALNLKDHEKSRNSTLQHFAHKATSRKEAFAEKAAKEEKDYFAAIQTQKAAKDQLAYLHHLHVKATRAKTFHADAAARHAQLQADLDVLYDSLFAGHTPAFPAEDRAEENCTTARHHLSRLHGALARQQHLLFLLGQVASKLSAARSALARAYDMSQLDMLGGGALVSMQKRNDLEDAESAVQAVRMLAGQIGPRVLDLGDMRVAVGDIWSDVVFDNVFTDARMHGEVKDSMQTMEQAGARCEGVIRWQEGELRRLEGEVKGVGKARVKLQRVREEAFRSVAGEHVGLDNVTSGYQQGDVLPPYSVT